MQHNHSQKMSRRADDDSSSEESGSDEGASSSGDSSDQNEEVRPEADAADLADAADVLQVVSVCIFQIEIEITRACLNRLAQFVFLVSIFLLKPVAAPEDLSRGRGRFFSTSYKRHNLSSMHTLVSSLSSETNTQNE